MKPDFGGCAGVEADGDLQVLANGPEGVPCGVVYVGHVLQVPGGAGHDDATMSEGDGAGDFGGGFLGGVDGNEALGDEPGALALPHVYEPVVVGLNAG